MTKIVTKELSPALWPDLETLFGKNGACAGCWYKAALAAMNDRLVRARLALDGLSVGAALGQSIFRSKAAPQKSSGIASFHPVPGGGVTTRSWRTGSSTSLRRAARLTATPSLCASRVTSLRTKIEVTAMSHTSS